MFGQALQSATLAAFAADLWLCIADPHRLGHERTYYPGGANFRAADVIIINKANTAQPVSPPLPGPVRSSEGPACLPAESSAVTDRWPSCAEKELV